MPQILPENILKGPFWPETVRVISVKTLGENQIRIEAVGLQTQRYYNPILSSKDLKSDHIIKEKIFSVTGNRREIFYKLI